MSQPKEPVALSSLRVKPLRELEKSAKRLDWITSIGGTVLGVLLSLLTSGVALSDSFPSLINSIRIRRTFGWFLAGVLGFQFVVILLLWLIRKKDREVIKLKQHLIGVYLSALDRSRLNPNPESNG